MRLPACPPARLSTSPHARRWTTRLASVLTVLATGLGTGSTSATAGQPCWPEGLRPYRIIDLGPIGTPLPLELVPAGELAFAINDLGQVVGSDTPVAAGRLVTSGRNPRGREKGEGNREEVPSPRATCSLGAPGPRHLLPVASSLLPEGRPAPGSSCECSSAVEAACAMVGFADLASFVEWGTSASPPQLFAMAETILAVIEEMNP